MAFALVPRWISYRLLSRNTSGIIRDLPDGLGNVHETVQRLYDDAPLGKINLIENDARVERRLLDWISPMRFEHLVIDLLELEAESGVHWHHVGGSGDGGVDGLAIDKDGRTVGAVQCKWHAKGKLKRVETDLLSMATRKEWSQVVIASLIGDQNFCSCDRRVRVLNGKEIAALVLKYRDRLPIASTLGL